MILLNSTAVAQPDHSGGIIERLGQIQHDNTAIDGSQQRNYMGEKAFAQLTWTRLTPTQYQQILAMVRGGVTVVYTNTSSNYAGGTLTFTGLPDFNEDEYVPGADLLRPFSVTLRQV